MAARQTRQKISAPAALALLALPAVLASCKTPSINLATSEPIKVDIAMRLDVYQHAPENGATTPVGSPAPTARAGTAAERAKNREADIQVFKNSRLVGEAHTGLLVILTEPAGDYGDYVRRTIAAENSDRMAQMKSLAAKQKRALPEIQKEQAALWANRSWSPSIPMRPCGASARARTAR